MYFNTLQFAEAAAVLFQIPLVILFGPPELAGLGYLCHHGIPPFAGGIEFGNLFFNFLSLFRIMPENRRTVLAAEIGALPVQRGRIMQGKKCVE